MKNRVIYGSIVGIILILIGVGLFIGWNEFILPNYALASGFPFELLVVFAFAAGLASFFAPCALPLFPAYVSYYLTLNNENTKGFKRLVMYGGLVGIGAVTFFVLLGFAFALFKESISQYVSIIQPAIGIILIFFGATMALNKSINLGIINTVSKKFQTKRSDNPKTTLFLYGFGYAGVSLGCTLPLLVLLFLIPFLGGKFLSTILIFLVYSFALALMMIIVTVLIAYSKDAFVKKIVGSTVTIKRISGVVMVLAGIYLVYYYLFLTMLPRLV